MRIVIVLLVLAVILAVCGFLLEGVKWLLILAGILAVAALVSWFLGRNRSGSTL